MDIRRISGNTQPNLYNNVNNKEPVQNAAKNAETVKSKPEIKDKINISAEAKQLNILDFSKAKIKSEMVKDISEVSLEKLNSLKEQIKAGTYHIESKDIAESILTGNKI